MEHISGEGRIFTQNKFLIVIAVGHCTIRALAAVKEQMAVFRQKTLRQSRMIGFEVNRGSYILSSLPGK